VGAAASELGISIKWQGNGLEELGVVDQVEHLETSAFDASVHVKPGDRHCPG